MRKSKKSIESYQEYEQVDIVESYFTLSEFAKKYADATTRRVAKQMIG